MRARLVVVVAIDRLGAGWLGPYGNTWLPTPHFDRLAARSLLCETAIAGSPDLAAEYRSYWSGCHVLEPDANAALSLPELARAANLTPVLMTDDRLVAEQPLAVRFQERSAISSEDAAVCARSWEETALYRLFAAATEELIRHTDPTLLWIHARGMSGPWDAPYEFRSRLADEADPPPPPFVAPPSRLLPANCDPDELLGLTQAYAGQVVLLDECLGLLLAALEEHPLGSQSLLIVTSLRGYPLGEHRRVGTEDEALYAELLQVPLLVRFPENAGALARSQALVQPASVYATIAEALAPPGAEQRGLSLSRLIAGVPLLRSDVAVSTAPSERAIRTPAWFLRERSGGEQPECELFAKPDDRWEQNEVASRCGEVPELLAAELARFAALARAGSLADIPPLAEVLTEVWR